MDSVQENYYLVWIFFGVVAFLFYYLDNIKSFFNSPKSNKKTVISYDQSPLLLASKIVHFHGKIKFNTFFQLKGERQQQQMEEALRKAKEQKELEKQKRKEEKEKELENEKVF